MKKKIFSSRLLPIVLLILFNILLYYKFFLFGKIPFPGDLMISSYAPWFDNYKIPVQNPLISDIFSQLMPWKYLAIESFKKGQWPLWNPYSFTGTPLLANYQSSSLNPFNILLLLPGFYGWGLYIFLQTLLASFSIYLLLSQWIKSRLAKITGSVIFSLGALMTTWLEYGTAGYAIAFLPLTLYSIYQFNQKSRFRYLFLLSISLSFVILAGHAQIIVYSFVVSTIFTLFCFSRKLLHLQVKQFLFCFIFLVLPIGLTSIQLLPSAELLQKSPRVNETSAVEYDFGLLPLRNIITFFEGDFFGNPITRNYWGVLNYFETSLFLGTLSLPLLIYILFFLKKDRISAFFLALFSGSLFFLFNNPFSAAIYAMKIPLLTFSNASRIIFITSLSFSVLAAISLNEIIELKREKKIFSSALWSLAASIGIIIGVIICIRIIEHFVITTPKNFTYDSVRKVYQEDLPAFLQNYKVTLKNSFLPVLIFSLFTCTLLIIIKCPFSQIRKNRSMIVGYLIFIFLTLDLTRYFWKFNPFVPSDYIFPTTPAIKYLQKQPGYFRIGREHAEVLPPNTWIVYNLYSLEGYDPLYLNEYGKYIYFLNKGDLRKGNSARYAELSENYISPFIDIANVKYFMGIGRDNKGHIPGNLINYKFQEAGYNVVFKNGSTLIFENPNALERIYFAKNIITATQQQAENIIMTLPGYNPRITTIINDDFGLPHTLNGEGISAITSYTPNKIEIRTETNQDQLLVFADQYDEGWHATIDGLPTRVTRANLVFRAIKIPSGKHIIKFSYQPESFVLGLKISIASLIFLLTSLGFAIIRRRY